MINGGCWHAILNSLSGYQSINGARIGLIGARDMSQFEKEYIKNRGIKHITVNQIKDEAVAAIQILQNEFKRNGVQRIHIHLDLDVFDPSIAPANYAAAEGGLLKDDVIKIIKQIKGVFPISSLSVASYDPDFDAERKLLKVACDVIFLMLSNDLW